MLKYLGRGILSLAILITAFILIKDSELVREADWLKAISGQEWLVYLVFTTSEIVFGLIPPELFMIWSLHHGISDYYTINVLFLFLISYASGVIGYYIGSRFSKTSLFMRFYESYLKKYEGSFRRYSGFILFVGAVTPLPFSAMCMLVGALNYSSGKFYLVSLTRILRFAVYGYLIWQVNAI